MANGPIINALNAPFWDGANVGRLMLPHCAATGAAFWPPSPISPLREGAGVEWREVAPVGVVCAIAVYRRVFLKLFEPLTPFGVALVNVGGARLQAHVPRAGSTSAPRPGDRVKLSFQVLVHDGAPALVAEEAP